MEEFHYHNIRDLQEVHWWFRGRRDVVRSILENLFHSFKKGTWLDVGAGFGSMYEAVKPFFLSYDAVEPYPPAAEYLKAHFPVRKVYQEPNFPENFQPHERYEVVSMFDVLEHMDDDVKALKMIGTKILKPSGLLIITVPAYQWLWSYHDEISHHKRRYTKSSLKKVLALSGYTIMKITYFNTLLFPLAALVRLTSRILKRKESDLSLPPSPFNTLFYRIFSSEKRLLRFFNMPFGLSIFTAARNVNDVS